MTGRVGQTGFLVRGLPHEAPLGMVLAERPAFRGRQSGLTEAVAGPTARAVVDANGRDITAGAGHERPHRDLGAPGREPGEQARYVSPERIVDVWLDVHPCPGSPGYLIQHLYQVIGIGDVDEKRFSVEAGHVRTLVVPPVR